MIPAYGTRIGVNISKRGTRGQLARGAVVGQVARITNLKKTSCVSLIVPRSKNPHPETAGCTSRLAVSNSSQSGSKRLSGMAALEVSSKPGPLQIKGSGTQSPTATRSSRVAHSPLKGQSLRHPPVFLKGKVSQASLAKHLHAPHM
jgi:hypothetical protein